MILPHSTWVDTGDDDDDGGDDDEEEDCKCGANVWVGRNLLNQYVDRSIDKSIDR